ncbi:outer membrane protein assembly factor BamB family protein [Gilvimarinus algae]|uniref:PQQ-binding-like beta-propeller repeat protein n=1 Tax=Gilvimarinus algae TaxID=3058037 RepID=A0ABT8TE26_9GAMM|nr:PQQ-binding-like beta-propeller repeat protein [Gilvimarinus sp. SDUM040014]MDO3382372.1 PQQ-binding-like beta-propeller repeat protein [Gilvimarinus sp. SDUM040014]
MIANSVRENVIGLVVKRHLIKFQQWLILMLVFLASTVFSAPGDLLWSEGNGGNIGSSVAYSSDNNHIFVGSADGRVYAYDVSTHAELWSAETASYIGSTPAISEDQLRVYVASYDGAIYALNSSDGAIIWRYETGASVMASVAQGADGSVYVGSTDGFFYALDGLSGQLQWRFNVGAEVGFSAAITYNNIILVPTKSGKLYALDPVALSQNPLSPAQWVFEATGGVASPVIGTDGTIYVGAFDHKLYAIDPSNGLAIWELGLGGRLASSPAIASDGTLYLANYDTGELLSVSPESGQLNWSIVLGAASEAIYASPAIGQDGRVYVGAFDSALYAVDPSLYSSEAPSAMVSKLHQAESPLVASPFIAEGGGLYLSAQNSGLIVIETEALGLADSAWPMAGLNAERTRRQSVHQLVSSIPALPAGQALPPGITADARLQAGAEYIIDSDVTVAAGAQLLVEAGVTLLFTDNYELIIEGELNVHGQEEQLVVFTSGEAAPRKNDWKGIYVAPGGIANIHYALIEYANNGIEFNGSNGGVYHSEVRSNQLYGIYIQSDSSLDFRPTPVIQDSHIHSNSTGIHIRGDHNLSIDPSPTITGNRIQNNSSKDLSATNYKGSWNTVIDARGNWWGTADAGGIAASISDVTDSVSWLTAGYSAPTVDFSGYLTEEFGNATHLESIFGVISGDITLEGGDYVLQSNLYIPSGSRLVLSQGVKLQVAGNFTILVEGELEGLGSLGSEVVINSDEETQKERLWVGVEVREGGSAKFDYSIIESARFGVNFIGSGGYFRNSLAQNNDRAIRVESVSGSGYTPEPQILNSTIVNNRIAFYIYGDGEAQTDSRPIIQNNSILDNTSTFFTAFYENPESVFLNAKYNWWGSGDVGDIANHIGGFNYGVNGVNSVAVNYGHYLNDEGGTPSEIKPLLGVMQEDATLNAGDTYELLSDFVVPHGTTLTIPQGVSIIVSGDFEIVVKGNLVVEGTEFEPVSIISDEDLTNRSEVNKRDLWEGITVYPGGSADIRFANIRSAVNGVHFDGSTGQVLNSKISYSSSAIYVASNANSTLRPTPFISGNDIFSNKIAIKIQGRSNSNTDPLPVVNANNFYQNTLYNYWAEGFANSAAVALDAQGNYWGNRLYNNTENSIYHFVDRPAETLPFVDYSNELDGYDGTPIVGSFLSGPVTGNTVINSGAEYTLSSDLYLMEGATLTIESGVKLLFERDVKFHVSGNLNVQGALDNPVLFSTAHPAFEAADRWGGIHVTGSGHADISNAVIEYAEISGVYFSGSDDQSPTGTISESVIRNNARGVQLQGVSINLTGNTFSENSIAVYLSPESGVSHVVAPTIVANNFISNETAIFALNNSSLNPDPLPVINGNSFVGNDTHINASNYKHAATSVINAKGNWWGSLSASDISARISDYSDSVMLKGVVDYSDFLDGPAGNPVFGNYLVGRLESDLVLAEGESYTLLSSLHVPVGLTLTLEAGAELIFSEDMELLIEGALVAFGSEVAPIKLHALDSLESGFWGGIQAKSGSSIDLDWLEVVGAATPIAAESPALLSITNSHFQDFTSYGLYVINTSSGNIANNSIVKVGDFPRSSPACIYINESTITFQDNDVICESNAIEIRGADSAPIITGNTITSSNYAFNIYGASNDWPTPIVQGNNISAGASGAIRLFGSWNSANVVIDMTDNWWGSASPDFNELIAGDIGLVDTSSPRTEAEGSFLTSPLVVSCLRAGVQINPCRYISPANSDGIQDSISWVGNLSEVVSWQVNIYSSAGVLIDAITDTSDSLAAQWTGGTNLDGRYSWGLVVNGVKQAAGYVEIDSLTPEATIQTPASGSVAPVDEHSIVITGNVLDSNISSYSLDYRVIGDQGNWNNISSGESNLASAVLGVWQVSSADTSKTTPPIGTYEIRLIVTDLAGNSQITISPIIFDYAVLTDVNHTPNVLTIGNEETLSVNFALSAPATVTLSIYSELDRVLIKEVSQEYAAATPAGQQDTLTWDAKNDQGDYVKPEAYEYILTATSSMGSFVYDPEKGTSIVSYHSTHSTNNDSDLYPEKNIPLISTVEVKYSSARFALGIRWASSPSSYEPVIDNILLPVGVHDIEWNGRSGLDQLVKGSFQTLITDPVALAPNSVIVKQPKDILPASTSPDTAIKSNPYKVTQSYDQVSTIAYSLNQDSFVTVQILPPGETNPNANNVVTLLDRVLQSATSGGDRIDHEVQWKGYEGDSNKMHMVGEGAYTFRIEIETQVLGTKDVYLGVLKLLY